MSIFSAMVRAIEGGAPPLQAIGTAITQTEQWGQDLVSKAEAGPFGAVVTTAVDDAKVVINDAGSWANTAIAGTLSEYGDEIASVVVKYAQKLGSGASPTSGALATLLGALEDVAKATVSHELLGFQNAALGALTPPNPPAPPAA